MDSYEEMIIPEVPKALPNEQLFIYVPTASNENLGVAKFDDEHFSVDPDGTVHSISVVTVGNITIDSSQWTDTTPTIAQFSISPLEMGHVLILMPADDSTKQAAVQARLSMYPVPFPSVGEDVVEFIRAEVNNAPTVNMNFVYLVFKTGSIDTRPAIALIGVDAYGEGGGTASGVDEEAVKALIDKEVPEWAKQPTKPTYTADEVNARPNTWMPTAEDVGARPNTWTPTASDVGADASGTAASKVTEHNTATDTHNDIRLLIQGLDARLTALADSDDTTLDQLSELVAYIKANRGLIESITTDKVNVADIINNLTTNATNKPLSAAQGVALKALIDALTTTVDGKTTPEQVAAQINTALTPYIKKEEADNTYQPAGDYLTTATGDQRYAKPSDIPTVPQTLPNPYALTILGKTYNGSSAVAMTVEEIIEAIKTASGGVVAWIGDDNNIYLTGNLTDGTYKAYYEANGEYIEIGDLTLGSVTPDPVTYTVTFVADGVTVAEKTYTLENPVVEEPAVPAKAGYTGAWETYDLSNGGDITVNAVYTAIEPAAPKDFAENFTVGRFKSDGTIDATTTAATVCTDYIGPIKVNDEILIKGFGVMGDYNSVWYNASNTIYESSKPNAYSGTNLTYAYDSASGVVTIKKVTDNAGYTHLRVGGKLTGTTADVVVNIKRDGEYLTE